MKITLFATTYCAFCKVEKQWLEKSNVNFEYIEVNNDPKYIDYLMDTYGESSVPLTEIKYKDDKTIIIRGFDRQALSKALNI